MAYPQLPRILWLRGIIRLWSILNSGFCVRIGIYFDVIVIDCKYYVAINEFIF